MGNNSITLFSIFSLLWVERTLLCVVFFLVKVINLSNTNNYILQIAEKMCRHKSAIFLQLLPILIDIFYIIIFLFIQTQKNICYQLFT